MEPYLLNASCESHMVHKARAYNPPTPQLSMFCFGDLLVMVMHSKCKVITVWQLQHFLDLLILLSTTFCYILNK